MVSLACTGILSLGKANDDTKRCNNQLPFGKYYVSMALEIVVLSLKLWIANLEVVIVVIAFHRVIVRKFVKEMLNLLTRKMIS